MKKLTILFSFLSTITSAQTMKFDIQGHRGCRGLRPENTIPAFLHALELGVPTLELDVIISKDKQVVVSHDPFFNPDITTDPNGILLTKETKENLYLLDYQAIKQFDCGLRGNPNFPEQQKMKAYKPLLSEMFEAVEAARKEKNLPPVQFNIEIKSVPREYNKWQPEVAEFSDLVYAEIMKYLPPERVILQSFDFNVLKYWHENMASGKYKKVRLAALIDPYKRNNLAYNLDQLGFKPDIWSPYFIRLGKRNVRKLHENGIKVIPWTVNKREDMEKMKAIGCDGLISDYPDRTVSL
jgi:glycerophosphoryl diester phosphodiesterase